MTFAHTTHRHAPSASGQLDHTQTDKAHPDKVQPDNAHYVTRILCHNLSYRVQDNLLLNKLNTDFQAGEISVVLGKNGAGKSTLISLLSKEVEAQSGQVLWQDQSLDSVSFAELAQQRAVLPQLQNLVFPISVQQLVELGAEVQIHSHSTDIKKITQKVMQVCDITHLAGRDVLSLSGGEQKRAQLARVLAQIWPQQALASQQAQPFLGKWLFLDEWTSSLDLHHQQQLAAKFVQWAKQGLGIVMVLHDLNLTSQIADNVKILQEGNLILEGSPESILTPPNIHLTLGLQVKTLPIDGHQRAMIVADFTNTEDEPI
ncbi:hemin import ATP-binding protein HmuV [Thiomicrorhabdus immobilis]|uniref:Hemin import ATP-binding protein HmuV n=1 Tax=Thiomicrorhabdus immobilis TaxID=2791037 RepID=A0ABN6D1Q6_9GAMM|nr:ATP-binding cassette domain-containing protein [Thiomicrorhabdus immobilis]BCN94062.1 hemin import ATP-binding protein HmuV [Thiomicrorhabdus immobilis]